MFAPPSLILDFHPFDYFLRLFLWGQLCKMMEYLDEMYFETACRTDTLSYVWSYIKLIKFLAILVRI